MLLGAILQIIVVGTCTWLAISFFIRWLENKASHYRHMTDVYERYTTIYVKLEGLRDYKYSSPAIAQQILTLRNEVIRIEMEFPEVKKWREDIEADVEAEID